MSSKKVNNMSSKKVNKVTLRSLDQLRDKYTYIQLVILTFSPIYITNVAAIYFHELRYLASVCLENQKKKKRMEEKSGEKIATFFCLVGLKIVEILWYQERFVGVICSVISNHR